METALLLIDVISPFDFPGGDQLLERALEIAPHICLLKQRAEKAKAPVIYVNDHFGDWRCSLQEIVDKCLKVGGLIRTFVEQVAPGGDSYLILKPKHSGFFQTSLEMLLGELKVKRLVLAGMCTDSCIQFTAQDAYMRDFKILVPQDCVTTQSEWSHTAALRQMQSTMRADITPSSEIEFL